MTLFGKSRKKEDYSIDNEVYAEIVNSGLDEKIDSYFVMIRTREYEKLIRAEGDVSVQVGVLKGIELCSQMFKSMNALSKSKK